eukprot:3969377-Prorocentrum_lima.AAC.1
MRAGTSAPASQKHACHTDACSMRANVLGSVLYIMPLPPVKRCLEPCVVVAPRQTQQCVHGHACNQIRPRT